MPRKPRKPADPSPENPSDSGPPKRAPREGPIQGPIEPPAPTAEPITSFERLESHFLDAGIRLGAALEFLQQEEHTANARKLAWEMRRARGVAWNVPPDLDRQSVAAESTDAESIHPQLTLRQRTLHEIQGLRDRLAGLRSESVRLGRVFAMDTLMAEHHLARAEEDVIWILLAAEASGNPQRLGFQLIVGVSDLMGDRLLAKAAISDDGILMASGLLEHDGDNPLASRGFHLAPAILRRLSGLPEEPSRSRVVATHPPCPTYEAYLDLILRLCEARVRKHELGSEEGEGNPARAFRRRMGRMGRPPWADDGEPEDRVAKLRQEIARLEIALESERKRGRWDDTPLAQLARRYELCGVEEVALVYLALASDHYGEDIFGPFGPRNRERTIKGADLLAAIGGDRPAQMAARKHLYKDARLRASDLLKTSSGKKDDRPECLEFRVESGFVRYVLGQGGKEYDATATATVESVEQDEGLVRRILPTEKLNDVILPESARHEIAMALASSKKEGSLLSRWGLEDKIPYGAASGFLFAGPPGTGKTHCARAIAGELGAPLLVVQVPKIMSCWVGQTEKLIQEVFERGNAEATAGHPAVLFFDEADSMFFSRDITVRSWEARDVNVLLGEIERYKGVIILATNRKVVLDEALSRRIQVVIDFPPPNAPAREAIWRRLMPPSRQDNCRLASDVDPAALAAAVALTGGEIKKAMIYALNLAEYRGMEMLNQATLLEAARAVLGDRWGEEGVQIGFVA